MSVIRFTKSDEQKDIQKYFQKYFKKSNIKTLILCVLFILFFTGFIIFVGYMEKIEPLKDSHDKFLLILIIAFLLITIIVLLVKMILVIVRLLSGNFFEKNFETYLKNHPHESIKSLQEDFSYGIKIKNTEAFGSRSWICPKHIFNAYKNTIKIYSIFEMKDLKWYKKHINTKNNSYDAFFISFIDKNNEKHELSFCQDACIDIVDTVKYNIRVYNETVR